MAEFLKHDAGKQQWHLLPWQVMSDVIDVLTAGEIKYPNENWKNCTDLNRYLDAVDRHLLDWRLGNTKDKESNKSHLIHAICNLLFLAALEGYEHQISKKQQSSKTIERKEYG